MARRRGRRFHGCQWLWMPCLRLSYAGVTSMATYDSFKKTLHCTDDVTYHLTSPVQCNGLFKYKCWYGKPESHCTASTKLLHCNHYTAALYSSAPCSLHFATSTPLHFIATPILHWTSLQGNELHRTACHCTVLHGAVLYTAMDFTTLYKWISQHLTTTCSVLHCSSLHGAVHFTILHPIIQWFTVFSF